MNKDDLGAQSATAVEAAGSSDTQAAPHVAHTPGPWKVASRENANCVSVWSAGTVITGIAYVHAADPKLNPEGEANAQLIAAAPELLQALKEILAHVEDVDVARVGNQCTLCHTYRSKGHRAIAKAEGRS